MLTRFFYLITLFISLLFTANAQENFADSIKQAISKISNEEEQLTELVHMAKAEQNLDSRLAILNVGKHLRFDISDSLMINYWIEVSYVYRRLNILDSAIYYAELFDQIAAKNDWPHHRAKACNVIAGAYTRQNKLDSAVSMYQRGLDFLEHYEGDEKQSQRSDLLGNLAGVFYYQDDYESAKKYSLQAQEIAVASGNIQSIVYGYSRLSILSELSNNTEDATSYSLKIIDIIERGEYKNDVLLAQTYMQLGAISNTNADYQTANSYLDKALGIIRPTGNKLNLVDVLHEKVKVLIHLGQITQARKLAIEAMDVAKETELPANILSGMEGLIRVAKASNNYTEALRLTEETILFKDSVKTIETNKQISELQTKYETEKKEDEIVRLSLENDLQSANLAKSRNLQIAIAIGAIMAMITLVIFFTLRNKKLRAEREAQELQVDALKKRFMELHSSPAELAVSLEFEDLNTKLNTPLTEREFETLKLSIEGKSNAEISEELFISLSTVKFHLRNTYSKMGVGNRKEAFQYMLKTS